VSNEPDPGHAHGPFGEMILILPGSALIQRVGSLASSQAAPARQSRDGIAREHGRVARALRLPLVVRTSSAPDKVAAGLD
jgi:hypothetical protein